jgi:cation diffusion facilitator family transporter
MGLLVAVVASLINLAASTILVKNGKKYNSITLEADGKHLMTDVFTSGGVLMGIGLIRLTGWMRLDGIVAIGVAMNIIWTGYQLIKRSALGLLDTAFPKEEMDNIRRVLEKYEQQNIQFHSLMTRQSGQRKFILVHILMPGIMDIQHGHNLAEKVENDIRVLFPNTQTTVFTHLEPIEDPVSMLDISIDRT